MCGRTWHPPSSYASSYAAAVVVPGAAANAGEGWPEEGLVCRRRSITRNQSGNADRYIRACVREGGEDKICVASP